MNILKCTHTRHRQRWTSEPSALLSMKTIQSCTAADMETITPNYYNARFNLKAMVDWIPLRLTVTMVRSEEWIDPESKGNCVGAE